MGLSLLPPEILAQILAPLDNVSLTCLMQCCRQFSLAVEPLLFAREDARDQAMFWACRRGYVRLIRRLVLGYGAPVSTVTIFRCRCGRGRRTAKCPRQCQYQLPLPVLTLSVAAARHQIDAFRELVDLGARVDAAAELPRWSLRQLMAYICSSPMADWALLRTFFAGGLDKQAQPGHHPLFTLPLTRVILTRPNQSVRSGPATLEAVRILLDRGACPNELHSGYLQQYLTPLTAAMRQCQGQDQSQISDPTAIIPVLDLLLSRGARIHGPSVECPVTRPTHSPVFVAAEAMAAKRLELMQWCLQNGADINQMVPVEVVMYLRSDDNYYHCPKTWPCYLMRGSDYYYATPALTYVDSIQWDSNDNDNIESNKNDTKNQRPVQMLRYLIEHGAQIDPPPDSPIRDQRSRGPTKAHQFFYTDTHWCLERLVWKWGLDKVQTHTVYRETVEFLLRHSVQRGSLAETLVRCEHALRLPPGVNHVQESVKIWMRFLGEILGRECGLDQAELTAQYTACRQRLRPGPLSEFSLADS